MCEPIAGAILDANGVEYCLWAPETDAATVEIGHEAEARTLRMEKRRDGYHIGRDLKGRAGDVYGYRLNGGPLLPDPASRGQLHDAHGRSMVVDPDAYQWTDGEWKRPPFRDLVIYEIHVGTFTHEGTFAAAAERLEYLQSLGITAIELMPVADFPGSRNWGYDGVLIYAPERCYGTPDDLRQFVDRAHAHGIAVILDVVYNHFGPDGNYMSTYSPHYFNARHHTPWGDAFNFDGEMAKPVRNFFLNNPPYWMREFHIDGFRFDATHQIPDDTAPHILQELTAEVHRLGGYAIAEDERNEALVIKAPEDGGHGFDGVWADDFHHSARKTQTKETHSYLLDFQGGAEELISILQHGWLYRGQLSRFMDKPRGTPCQDLPPKRFVHCISNHDQVGNRAFGERLNHIISPEAYRALSVLICLTPYTPMLFMGQEWSASTPFQFFTEHEVELGRKITEGRRKEFAFFPEFADEKLREKIPDPQAATTFEKSKLHWEESELPPHVQTLNLYRDCLRLRQKEPVFRPLSRNSWSAEKLSWGAGAIHYGGQYLLLFDLEGGHSGQLPANTNWKLALSSNAEAYGGNNNGLWNESDQIADFASAASILLVRK